jgi:uncharacterized caspase-like protein
MPLQKEDYALVIGVNHYPNYRPLQGARKDAQDFADWLVDRSTGGGLYKKNCKVILSRNRPLKPILDDINVALEEIRTQAKDGGRRFYFYFNGHGQTATFDNVNLCLARWSNRASRTALSSRDCVNFVVNCIGFKEVVTLLDCCRVTVVGAAGWPPGVTCPKAVAGAGAARVFMAYATKFQNSAYEAAATDTAIPPGNEPLVIGHFTKALLEALSGQAASSQGGVKPSALKEYLEQHVPRIASDHKHIQWAEVQNNLDD